MKAYPRCLSVILPPLSRVVHFPSSIFLCTMKRYLITGGSRGLGLCVARALLESGAEVLTCARRKTEGVRAMETEFGDRLRFAEVDFAEKSAVSRLVCDFGILDGVDGFVANAAVGYDGLLTLSGEESIRLCVEVNLMSPMLLAREVVKGMLLRKQGSLVFISSVAARTGLSGLTVYSATKAGLCGFSKSLAREYGRVGIRSNCVLPGFLTTEMTHGLSDLGRDGLARRTSLKRLGAVEDVVGAICFLLSESAAFVTGTEVVVDGGMV